MEMKKKVKKRKEQKRKSMQLKLFFSLNISPCLGQKQFFSRKENTYSENKVFFLMELFSVKVSCITRIATSVLFCY